MCSSTSLKIATLATLLVAAPLAGAYAAGHHKGALDASDTPDFYGPRLTSFIGQVDGVKQGIADARQANNITPAEARALEMRADRISQAAEKVASSDRGRIPSSQYHQLMHRLDNLDQRLLTDTGSGFNMGDGSDGGNYPNG